MRHIFIGTKVWPECNIVKDCVYVQIEENGELWLMDIERNYSQLVINKNIKQLKKYFDEWTDLGTIPDGVRISNVLTVTHRVGMKVQ